MRVLVTGSSGHLAGSVIPRLESLGHTVVTFDLPFRDVLNSLQVATFARRRADVCIHLAGLKYATTAEVEPLPTVEVNVRGTANVVAAFGSNVVLASTCKAADPETVYGCSKLIAERIVLGSGGRIARLVNVLGSVGSVTDIWQQVPLEDPLPVCDATRLFITDEIAADLIVDALEWPAGRYGPRRPTPRFMSEVAHELYPGRAVSNEPLRRGDRKNERLVAVCEYAEEWTDSAIRITGQHDPVYEEEEECVSEAS